MVWQQCTVNEYVYYYFLLISYYSQRLNFEFKSSVSFLKLSFQILFSLRKKMIIFQENAKMLKYYA